MTMDGNSQHERMTAVATVEDPQRFQEVYGDSPAGEPVAELRARLIEATVELVAEGVSRPRLVGTRPSRVTAQLLGVLGAPHAFPSHLRPTGARSGRGCERLGGTKSDQSVSHASKPAHKAWVRSGDPFARAAGPRSLRRLVDQLSDSAPHRIVGPERRGLGHTQQARSSCLSAVHCCAPARRSCGPTPGRRSARRPQQF